MTHIAHAFTPDPTDPTGECTAPLALFAEPRCRSEPLASPRTLGTDAVNATPEPAPEPRQEQPWWLPIVNGLWHAWQARELCDTWTRDDLADEMVRQIRAEARARNESMPSAAPAAVAEMVTIQHQGCAWWQSIVDSQRHAWRIREPRETRDDLADAIADALVAEARRLTAATEELVTVPNEALAAVARIRKGE